ncbi:AAA family ATPase [Azospirillum tabaci]|uniref:AAA family ATPase n=1 Tax=Azospirillum tabaci TaxID=2752310 RepID=UPI001660A751|nr:AAA family ATPase [Azospirillum tabaci]
MTTFLILNRLAVYYKNKAVFDETFHRGINILHGDNGSGKSTIADFIFFALGGDLRDWKPHASRAEYVVAEIQAQESTITIRRDVSTDGSRPMYIYFGSMNEALEANITSWQRFPYRRSDGNFSFSQVLFKAIGLPESVSEGSANVTMHQMLRLLYGDQMTPIQRIFRTESFDTWQIRQAVGELMCGIGGYDLYDKQIELRSVEKEYDVISDQLKSLMSVAAGYGDKILAEHISAVISNKVSARERILNRIHDILAEAEFIDAQMKSEAEKAQKELLRELSRSKKIVSGLEDEIETLEYEIQDTDSFISHLKESLADFEDASVAHLALGRANFENCPSCFAPIQPKPDEDHCQLCGSAVSPEDWESRALAIRLDLEMQLKESCALQKERNDHVTRLKGELRVARTKYRNAYSAYSITRQSVTTSRDTALADLSRQVGYLDSEIEVLQQRLELAKEISRVSSIKDNLNSRIGKLKNSISSIIFAQGKRKAIAYTLVSERAKRILNQDLQEHSDFGKIDHVSFSFAEDWIAINGEKNVSRSASGMVVLKNSFLVSLLVSSLLDRNFYLPRFLLLDNIEDKGMVQERSWNFQRVMIKETATLPTEFQIIFTTSKIAPELADTSLVIGRKFTRERPSLDFS